MDSPMPVRRRARISLALQREPRLALALDDDRPLPARGVDASQEGVVGAEPGPMGPAPR